MTTEPRAQGTARFMDPSGATWEITLREGCDGATAAALVKALGGLSGYLLEHGWAIAGDAEASLQGDEQLAGGEDDPSWCPIHRCTMQKHTKGGQTWYSHKTPEGAWCRGK